MITDIKQLKDILTDKQKKRIINNTTKEYLYLKLSVFNVGCYADITLTNDNRSIYINRINKDGSAMLYLFYIEEVKEILK